jgi:hypothetical protein
MTINITLNAFYNLALSIDVWEENSVKYYTNKKNFDEKIFLIY